MCIYFEFSSWAMPSLLISLLILDFLILAIFGSFVAYYLSSSIGLLWGTSRLLTVSLSLRMSRYWSRKLLPSYFSVTLFISNIFLMVPFWVIVGLFFQTSSFLTCGVALKYGISLISSRLFPDQVLLRTDLINCGSGIYGPVDSESEILY